MVTWAGDGTMAGYDPITKKLKKGLYHFATPGSVDLNANTRLNYFMGAGLSATTYPNNLQITAPLAFTSADFAANGNKKLGVGLILVRSDRFPAGHTPTPAEIWALPETSFDSAQRATEYVFGPGGITHTFELPTDAASGYYWNTKWWAMLYPAVHNDTAARWSKTNDPPLTGTNLNTIARVLSFWSNRTPGKPKVASPVDGAQVLPGAEFTLRLDPADPDEVAPEDGPKYNDDVNGVHFQYRAAPTLENPSPEWIDLPFDWEFTSGGTVFPTRDEAWNIRGTRYWNGIEGTPYHEALVANLGCRVVAGAKDTDIQPGKGALPTGNWQIRGRTFDYGHPYPNSGTKTNEPGPLGINPAINWIIEPAKDTYPALNTSPWSDPIIVNIPSQVPPPLAVSPKDSMAVSGNAETDTIRLQWQYRNTHQPARTQFTRTVQIRKVGDAAWSTVFSGVSADPYVDLPKTLTQTAPPPLIANPDGSSEAGTVPWVKSDSNLPTVITNVNDATKAHAGSRFIKAANPAGSARFSLYTDDFSFQNSVSGLPWDYTTYSFDGWFWIDATVPVMFEVIAQWLDADGLGIQAGGENPFDTPYVMFFVSKFFTGPAQWRRISDLIPDADGTDYQFGLSGMLGADPTRLTVTRPPNGVSLVYAISALIRHDNPASLPTLRTELRIDDFYATGTPPVLDNFELVEANQYEWRVRVADTDGIESLYSTPARFWMVPGAGTGAVRPIPTATVDGATLGCGTHHVVVYRRGGKERVGELTGISHVDWSRVRDDISTAQVEVSGWDLDCGNLLARLQTWAYELVIYRNNGYTKDRVWEGPITLLTYERDKVTIDAKDVMGYAYRRIIKQKMTDSGTGNGTTVTDRARRVLQNAFAPDDPNVLAYLQVLAREDDAMQYRSTPAYSRTAFEEVDDMAANAGLDYTAIGRSILLWGTKHRIGTLPELRDEDLGASPIVSEYGMSMANFYSVSDGNGVHGEASRLVSGNDPTYGLVEMLSSTWASDSENDSGTYTQAGLETVTQSFKDFAERSIADRYPPPVVVRIPDNTTLNPDTVLSIQHLVPGVVIPLRSTATLRSVADSQKLDLVKVVEENGKETVSITLSPFSRDDAAITEGGGDL